MKRLVVLAVLFLVATLPSRSAEPSAEVIEFFERKIRPILVDNCQRCHSSSKQKANLSFASLASMLKGGDSGPALVVGQPEASLLIKAIRYQDELRMPPRGKLSDEQIADLTAWVKMGAPWPSLSKDTQGQRDRQGLRPGGAQEVLVLAAGEGDRHPGREAAGLAAIAHRPLHPGEAGRERPDARHSRRPANAAAATVLRPDRLAAVAGRGRRVCPRVGLRRRARRSRSRLAIEKVVDRLLASPHYGERWGRHWLDLVRYAETRGHEFDFEIPDACAYRDYVIRAFNADVPYDQFVRRARRRRPAAAAARGIRRAASTNRSSAPASGSWARPSTRRSTSAATRPTASTTRSTSSARRSWA